jgi:hypothetical protein
MSREHELVDALQELGVEVRRITGDEINARCPVHVKHKGRESDGYSWYMNVETGLWQCFTCGARGNLNILLSELAADPAQMWNIQRDMIASGLHRMTYGEEDRPEPEVQVDWVAFGQFAPLPAAMLELRGLSAEAAQRYGIRWDTETKRVIQPFIAPNGALMGWQAKKQSTKQFENTPEGVHKSDTLFGIERVVHTTGLLLESPLDVVRWHTVMADAPVSAVSSFGASVSDTQIELLNERFDRLILALDNDPAGITETLRLAGQGKYPVLLAMRHPLRYWDYKGTKAKDIGDMTDEEIRDGYQRVSPLPPRRSIKTRPV